MKDGLTAPPPAVQGQLRPHKIPALQQPRKTGTANAIITDLHDIQGKLGTGNDHNNRSDKD